MCAGATAHGKLGECCVYDIYETSPWVVAVHGENHVTEIVGYARQAIWS